jgi:glycosyltransferase involved in cell wall biosynthesis
VVVVDNGSADSTSQEAEAHGATVVHCAVVGKGEAMRAGVAATDGEVVLFADGDLVGLQPEHVDALVGPVLEGRAAMACGLFDRRWLNPVFLYGLPTLTGERALTRRLFESVNPGATHGYRVEAALNERCRELGVPTVSFVCPGLWHRPKERKYPSAAEGFVRKVEMLMVAGGVYARSRLRHLFP